MRHWLCSQSNRAQGYESSVRHSPGEHDWTNANTHLEQDLQVLQAASWATRPATAFSRGQTGTTTELTALSKPHILPVLQQSTTAGFKPCPAYSDLPCSFTTEDEMPFMSLHALSTSQGGGVSPPTLGAPPTLTWKHLSGNNRKKKNPKKTKQKRVLCCPEKFSPPLSRLGKAGGSSQLLDWHYISFMCHKKKLCTLGKWHQHLQPCPAQRAAAFPGISFPRSTDSQGFS